MLSFWVNDHPYQYSQEIALQQLLSDLSMPNQGVAVAVNQEVIPKLDWPQTFLKDQDKVLVIKATQGG
jgi:sulfur carrier protein